MTIYALSEISDDAMTDENDRRGELSETMEACGGGRELSDENRPTVA